MTNGENTAFVPIREYLMSRNCPGYIGYNSDSEVFTHILHYTVRQLGFPITYYKDVITPLKESEIEAREDKAALRLIKQSLRPLCIDGPNVVIGFTPDGTCFMAHNSKKLRPGVVGGVKGKYALMSEECGLDSAIPKRNKSQDIFPMKYDMVIVTSGRGGTGMETATELDYNHQLSLKELPYIIRWRDDRCKRCGSCTAVCPIKAIEATVKVQRVVQSEGPLPTPTASRKIIHVVEQVTDIERYCTGCGTCTLVCPNDAIEPEYNPQNKFLHFKNKGGEGYRRGGRRNDPSVVNALFPNRSPRR